MNPPKIKTSAGMETVDETVARAKAQIASPGKQGNAVITPEALTPTPSLKLQAPATPTVAPTLLAQLEAQTDSFTQGLEAKRQTAETSKNTALSEYLTALKNTQGQTSLEADAYAQKGGVNDISVELNDINDQIRREQLSLRRAQENVMDAGAQSKGQAQSQLNNISRESLRKQADLSIIQMAVQGRYDSAVEIADRAVKARFEQQQIYNDALRFNYEENKDTFSEAEQREFSVLLSNRDRSLRMKEQMYRDIQGFAITALQAGASVAEARQIQNAQSMEEAIAIGGSYLRPKPVAVSSGFKSPEIKEINGVDYQWNPTTGQWEEVSIAGGGPADPKQQQITELLSLASELRSDKTAGKSGAIGFGLQKFVPFGQSLGLQGNRSAFENKLNTLKANLTLDNLSLLKGPMSDKDLAFLQSVGSSLSPGMSEKAFNSELDRIITKFKGASTAPTPQAPMAQGVDPRLYSGTLVVTPDGQQVEIID